MEIKLSRSITPSAAEGRRAPRPYLLRSRLQTAPPFELEGTLVRKLSFISEREGEDAQITGGTRSLHRRLLALNLHGTFSPIGSQTTPPAAATDSLIA